MFSIKKIFDRFAVAFYNLGVGSAIIMFFDNHSLSLYITILSFLCGVWLTIVADTIIE